MRSNSCNRVSSKSYRLKLLTLSVLSALAVAGTQAQTIATPALSASNTAIVNEVSGAPQKPLVIAHYMSWFQTPEFSGSWGFWQVNRPTIPRQYWHWPDRKTTNGCADVASVYSPVIGPYDSADPDTCEYHILLAKLAGIDAFVADWYGPQPSAEHPYDNIGFLAMKKAAEKLDFKVLICWEDRSMFPPISKGVSTRAEAVESGKQMVRYLAKEWFSSPAYLKIDGRPVMTDFAYGQAGNTLNEPWLSAAEWNQVLQAAQPLPLLIHDWHRHFKAPEFRGYGSVVPWGDTYHGDADRADAFWAQAEAAVGRHDNLFLSGAVLPGFDNRGCGGWGTDGAIGMTDRRDGKKFRATWEDVMRHPVKFVQIATWNDLNEGGTIEPVREVVLHPDIPAQGYGYRELETVAEYAGKLKGIKLDHRALRVPEKLYQARKLVEQMCANKLAMPPGASAASLTQKLDQARAALLAGDIAAAQSNLAAIEHP
jgi:hypothetical protein